MAVLAFAALGSAIGGSVGFASLGWAAGSIIGNMLFPGKLPDQQGPRLSDLKVQTSSYGNTLPIVKGAVRIAGNVIWSTDIVEHKHTEDVGGGKGGGPSQEVTTYSYTVSCAIAFCEGPIAGFKRIWANGRLILDAGSDASAGNIAASKLKQTNLRVYLGDETQLPDATIEANLGVGNVPAYRGAAYIVLTDLELADFGNSIPNFTAEIVESGTVGALVSKGKTVLNASSPFGEWQIGTHLDNSGLHCFEFPAAYNVTGTGLLSFAVAYKLIPYSGAAKLIKQIPISVQGSARNETSFPCIPVGRSDEPGFGIVDIAQISPTRYRFNYVRANGQGFNFGVSAANTDFTSTFARNWVWAKRGDFICWGDQSTNRAFLASFSGSVRGELTLSVGVPMVAVLECFVTDGYAYVSGRHAPGVQGNEIVKRYSLTGAWVDDWLTGSLFSGAPTVDWVHAQILSENEVYFPHRPANGLSRCVYGATTLTLVGTGFDAARGSSSVPYTFQMSGNLVVVWTSETFNPVPYGRAHFFTANTVQAIDPTVGSIVANLCARAGLAPSQYDVSALTETLTGYVVANQSTVRACLEQLATGFFFDATESDALIKFVTRGGATALIIAPEDLVLEGESVKRSITRAQEIELPQRLNLVFLDKGLDGQQNAQKSRRWVGLSKEEQTIELPVVLTADKAKKIADKIIYNAWTERLRHSFNLPERYSRLEPTDVVSLSGKVLRLTRVEWAAGVLQCEGVSEDAFLYTQSAPAAFGPLIAQIIEGVGPTSAQYLDIPLLRDGDDVPGFYLAAHGVAPGWKGLALYRSTDNGASYSNVATHLPKSTMGSTTNALGSFDGRNNIFDEHNNVIVRLAEGTLSACTELQCLAGQNLAVIGNELVMFQDVTLNGDGTYTLKKLLRGRFGTEQYIAGHAVDDRFVLLTLSTITTPTDDLANTNVATYYKPVSLRDSIATTLGGTFTNTEARLKPYSPVHFTKAGNVLQWVPRGRINNQWLDAIDTPLGETIEKYEVEVLDAVGAVLSTTSVVAARALALSTYKTVQYVDFMPWNEAFGAIDSANTRLFTVGNGVMQRRSLTTLALQATYGATVGLGQLYQPIVNGSDVYVVGRNSTGGASSYSLFRYAGGGAAGALPLATFNAAAGTVIYRDIIFANSLVWIIQNAGGTITVTRHDPSTLAQVGSVTVNALSICYDPPASRIYCLFMGELRYIDVNTFGLVTINATPDNIPCFSSVVINSTHVFAFCYVQGIVLKYQRNSGTLLAQSASLGNIPEQKMHADSANVYVGGYIIDQATCQIVDRLPSGQYRADSTLPQPTTSVGLVEQRIVGVDGARIFTATVMFLNRPANAIPTALYDLVEWTAGSPGVSARVYEISSRVGRGFPAALTF